MVHKLFFVEGMSELVAGGMICTGAVSMLLNGLLLVVVARVATNTVHRLIVAASLADLLYSLSAVAMCSVRLASGEQVFAARWYCGFFGFTNFVLTCVASLCIGLLGLERYRHICHNRSLPPLVTAICVLGLVLGLLASALGTSITGAYKADPTLVYCLPFGNTWARVMSTIGKGVLALSLPVLVGCYLAIFLRLEEQPFHSNSPRALLFIAIYLLCYLVPLINILYGVFRRLDRCPVAILALAPILQSAAPAVNPMLALHRTVRESFLPSLLGTRCPLGPSAFAEHAAPLCCDPIHGGVPFGSKPPGQVS